MTTSIYVITAVTIGRLKKKYGIDPCCPCCGQLILPGQRIVSKPSHYRRKIYHEPCLESLYYVPEEQPQEAKALGEMQT
jgi:hypothetical protein